MFFIGVGGGSVLTIGRGFLIEREDRRWCLPDEDVGGGEENSEELLNGACEMVLQKEGISKNATKGKNHTAHPDIWREALVNSST
jgi:hypothetical protein